MKYFSRKKYRQEVISLETYNKWINDNPQYSHIKYEQFVKYWKMIRTEIINTVRDNYLGYTISKIGNFSIKVMDIDFKCAKDFLVYTRNYKTANKNEPSITTNDPKKVKIVWKKEKFYQSIFSLLGSDPSCYLKNLVLDIIHKNRLNTFSKSKLTTKSKCEDVKEKSAWDLT